MSWKTTFYSGGSVPMSALSGSPTALWDSKGEANYAMSSPNLHRRTTLAGKVYRYIEEARRTHHQLRRGKVRSDLKVYAWIGASHRAMFKHKRSSQVRPSYVTQALLTPFRPE